MKLSFVGRFMDLDLLGVRKVLGEGLGIGGIMRII